MTMTIQMVILRQLLANLMHLRSTSAAMKMTATWRRTSGSKHTATLSTAKMTMTMINIGSGSTRAVMFTFRMIPRRLASELQDINWMIAKGIRLTISSKKTTMMMMTTRLVWQCMRRKLTARLTTSTQMVRCFPSL